MLYVKAHTKATHMSEIALALVEIIALTPRGDGASAYDVFIY